VITIMTAKAMKVPQAAPTSPMRGIKMTSAPRLTRADVTAIAETVLACVAARSDDCQSIEIPRNPRATARIGMERMTLGEVR
jgi:hypothetical protein